MKTYTLISTFPRKSQRTQDLMKRFFGRFFQLYLWLSLRERDPQKHSNRVYDHWGVIDTLGSDSCYGRWTYSYSNEGGSEYGIRIPYTKYWVIYINSDDQYLVFQKGTLIGEL